LLAYLVPESDISSTVIDDGPQLAVLLEIVHESLQSVDTVDEIEDSLFVVLLVQSLPDIIDGFAENGGKSDTHGSLDISVLSENITGGETRMSKGVLMVASVCRSVGVASMGEKAYMRAKEAGLECQLVPT
jgi:hypothetical protein